MTFTITTTYAALLTLWLIALAGMVSAKRGKTGISILHGQDMALALAIRRHGNLTEYLPMAIILMGLAEARGAPAMWLHGMGIVLVVSRLVHAAGLSVDKPADPLRIAGGAGTQTAMAGAAGYLLWTSF